jgi:hypothetical protein
VVPAHLGVDEKAAGPGQDYITVVSDLDKGTVEHLADEPRQASLNSSWFSRHECGWFPSIYGSRSWGSRSVMGPRASITSARAA